MLDTFSTTSVFPFSTTNVGAAVIFNDLTKSTLSVARTSWYSTFACAEAYYKIYLKLL